jgi:hypothetical protein
MAETEQARMEVEFVPGTRHAASSVLIIPLENQAPMKITFEPLVKFQMRGIGYGHPKWGHGRLHGPLEVEREAIVTADADPNSPENWHIQAISKVTLSQVGQPDQEGVGVFEQLVAGPYKPYGLS